MIRKVEAFVPLLQEAFDNDKTFKMPVKGTSMLPFINEKHYVILKKVDSIKKNDIVFYRRDSGQYVLHRIFKVKKDHYVLLGDNQVYREYPIYKKQIIGKVIAVCKGEKIHHLKGLKYKLYIFFWSFRAVRLLCFPFTRRRKIK